MSFKHRMVTQIAKIGLSLSQSPWLSFFFLKAFVGSDTMELRMEIATIVVTAVQVLPNPVHKEICCLSGGWASFTLLKAKVSKQGPLGEESPHPENCHDILYAQLCQEKRKIGFKLTREEKTGENTKEFWSAPQNMAEQPLNCGFAFGECAQIQNSGTCWNSQYIIMKFELLKTGEGHADFPRDLLFCLRKRNILSTLSVLYLHPTSSPHKKSQSGERLHLE